MIPKIRVIGLGGCGGKAIDHMIRSGVDGVDFILADRDIQSKNSSLIQQSILLETDLSKTGDRAIERPTPTFKKDKQKILQALEGGDMVFIIVGLGGGTGTFWAPVIAEICSKLDILNVAVVTMPLCNGPSQPRRWAEKGLEKLSTLADTVIPVDLDVYDSTLYPENDIREVYDLGHKTILEAVKRITGLLLLPGCISIDFKDLKSLFYKKGLADFQIGVGEGRDRARKAAQMAVADLSGWGIRLAAFQQVLLSFTVGPNVSLKEITEASGVIRKEMENGATILWGAMSDETIEKAFKITVFAIGKKYQKPHPCPT